MVEIAEQMESMYLKPRLNLNLNCFTRVLCVCVSLCVYICVPVCTSYNSRLLLAHQQNDVGRLYHNLQQELNDICTIKAGLIIMQITGPNFYRDPGIHGFCTWNENTEQPRLTMFLLLLYFLYGCLLLPRRQASFPLILGFPGARLCCEQQRSQRVE